MTFKNNMKKLTNEEKGISMKYEDKTTKEDEENRIIRIVVTPETWEENKLLAKGMGIEIVEPNYVECVIDLKKKE